MEHRFKKVFILAIFIVVIFATSKVNAASPPDTITLIATGNNRLREVAFLNGTISGSAQTIRTYTKQASDGGYAYCIEADDDSLSVNQVLTKDSSEITDPGVLYLAQNGYPNSTSLTTYFSDVLNKRNGFESYFIPEGYELGGTKGYTVNDYSYYTTQIAVWLYYWKVYGIKYAKGDLIANSKVERADNYTGTSNPSNLQHAVVDKAFEIFNGAVNAHNNGTSSTGELTVNATSSSNKLTFNNGNLISEPVTVSITGASEYTVTTTNGATVLDVNGNAKNTFSANENFRISYASQGNATYSTTVNISVSNTINHIYKYDPSNSSDQSVMYTVIYPTTNTATSQLAFEYTASGKQVTISKQDITTSKELPGASLKLTDESGNVIDEWISTDTPHVIYLDPGKYMLQETIAPEGYIKSDEVIEFTISSDSSTSGNIVMKNQPIQSVSISKQDVTTGEELPGATLEIYREDGTLVDTWVSTDTPNVFRLDPGKYSLKETVAPEGYVQTTEVIEFTVNSDGTVSPSSNIVMKNQPIINVPKTALNSPQIMFLASVILGGFGLSLIYIAKKEII